MFGIKLLLTLAAAVTMFQYSYAQTRLDVPLRGGADLAFAIENNRSGAATLQRTSGRDVATTFALAVDLCLEHVRSRDPVAAFRENGFTVTPQDEGTFKITADGVSGSLAPLLITEWCWIESEQLGLQQVQDIVYDRARAFYGDGVSGPADRRLLANGCPSLTFLYANSRIATLEFRNAGFFQGCDGAETGGVLFG